jgi:hypothetical protein
MMPPAPDNLRLMRTNREIVPLVPVYRGCPDGIDIWEVEIGGDWLDAAVTFLADWMPPASELRVRRRP